jgi:hypothetical protein
MLRRLFILLSLISLILCLALIALCLRGFWRHDFFEYSDGGVRDHTGVRASGFVSGWTGTSVTLASVTAHSPASLPYVSPQGFHWTSGPRLSRMYFSERRWLGFGLPRTDNWVDPLLGTTNSRSTVLIPYWFLILLTSILPALFAIFAIRTHRARVREKRSRLGLCQTCGYDLRASKDRCPECGSPIPQITNNK